MRLVDRLPLWIADTWVESLSATESATARVKKQLEVAEGILELLGVSFLASVLAHRTLVSTTARERIATAAARCFAKRSAFGDWVQLVDAGFKGGPVLVRLVAGVDELPAIAATSPLVGVFAGALPDSPCEPSLIRFFEGVAQFRNEFSHRRAEPHENEEIAPRLAQALESVVAALPGLLTRPLCHVARAAAEQDGFVVVYRHLTGSGRVPDATHAIKGQGESQPWRGNLLAFWDGSAPTPTPVPEWLARYDRNTHTLQLCQGTDPGRRKVLFHVRQLEKEATDSATCFDALWKDLAAIGATLAPAKVVAQSTQPGEVLYVDAFRRALANDGVVTSDERELLDGIAEGIGLSGARRAELEKGVGQPTAVRTPPPTVAPPPSIVRPPDAALPQRGPRGRGVAAAAVLGVLAAVRGGWWLARRASAGGAADTTGGMMQEPGGGLVWRSVPAGMLNFSEGPTARAIDLRTFELSETEVTNRQYGLCIIDHACDSPHYTDKKCLSRVSDGRVVFMRAPDILQADDRPVVCVTPAQTATYARWAGARLPSEAEWEYAARDAGRNSLAPWGDEPADCTHAIIETQALGPGCGLGAPEPVTSGHIQGSFGLRDLIGNVFEIVADGYHPMGPPADGSPREVVDGGTVVIRGGGWRAMAQYANATKRGEMKADEPSQNIGFRVARDVRP